MSSRRSGRQQNTKTMKTLPTQAHESPSDPPLGAARLLSGLRVLDLTNVLSGPFCTYQLSLLGAEVIKIEHPGLGDLARQLGADPELNQKLMGTSFMAQNAGKKSVTIDLKNAGGKETFLKLMESADAVVENFRPGVMERLGLDYPSLRTRNPRIVYCAISGFGQDGPLSDQPAYDQIIQGMSGVMSITGDAESAPLRVGYPICDTLGGMTAAFALVSALYATRNSREGCFVDVSMLDSTLAGMGWVVSNYLMAGVEPAAMGNENMTAAPSGTFITGDGLLNIAANTQAQYEKLCRLLNRIDLLADPRFAERESRKRHRAELKAELERALQARSAAEWALAMNADDVPAGCVLTVPDALQHPQIGARRLVQTLPGVDGVADTIRVVRAGYRVAEYELGSADPPPRLGQHTDEVLSAMGLGANAITQLRATGAI